MKLVQFTALMSVLVFSQASFAHHSDAGMDEGSVVTLEGKITEFLWRQPHVYFGVEVMENGEPLIWDVQLGSLNGLSRSGWHSESLKPGEEVFVRVNPAINGRPYGKLSSIERLDGSPVAIRPGEPAVNKVKADSLAGNWIADRTRSGPSYPGGFDGFFNAHLVLTEAGKAAKEDYDPLSSDNPESTCVGRPTPSAFVSTTGYLMQFDLTDAEERIVINSEWYNEQRTIYMDGRDHPGSSTTFATGHSIGYWDEDTLVIDTRNFDNHRSPYQVGVPSGSQKHVVERYRLIEDGTAMTAEFILEDPEFIAEPMRYSRVLLHSPHMQMLGSNCDLESTTRLLKLGG